jgi:fatty acid desaturase
MRQHGNWRGAVGLSSRSLGRRVELPPFRQGVTKGRFRACVYGWVGSGAGSATDMRHLIGVAVVLSWAIGVCGISLPLYLGAIVYPSVSLALLRSFAEHRAAPDPRHRTAIVEAHPFWALLFLNNQLHFVHHAAPILPWYALPRAWRDMKPSAVVGPGLVFSGGYHEVARKYLFRPFIPVEHPGREAE